MLAMVLQGRGIYGHRRWLFHFLIIFVKISNEQLLSYILVVPKWCTLLTYIYIYMLTINHKKLGNIFLKFLDVITHWHIEAWTKWPPICKIHFQLLLNQKNGILIGNKSARGQAITRCWTRCEPLSERIKAISNATYTSQNTSPIWILKSGDTMVL